MSFCFLLRVFSDTAGTIQPTHRHSLVHKHRGVNTLREILTSEVQGPVDGCPSLQPFRQTSLRGILYMSHQVSAESSPYCLQQCPKYYILILAFTLFAPSHLLPGIIPQIKCLHPSPCLRLYFQGNPKKCVIMNLMWDTQPEKNV